ncbi:MAG: class I SAM-dependent methyltransferase [Mycobacteriales bacterium]
MGKPPTPATLDWGIGSYERTAELLLPAARFLVEKASPQPGERVLDLGCGTGSAALLAAASGAHVTAVDPSPRLLEVARDAAARQGLTLTCELGDAAALPASDKGFDCLLSNFALIFAPDPDAAVAEIVRVLDDEGRALFTAWLPGGGIGAFASTAQELVRAALNAPPDDPGFPWHDADAVTTLFARHGMRLSSQDRAELAFTASSPEEYLEAERVSHPMAVTGFQILQQLGQAEQAQQRLLEVLTAHNEDPVGFRCTSRYVVFSAHKGER